MPVEVLEFATTRRRNLKKLSAAFLLLLAGIALLLSQEHYRHASCWGHLGCDYFERIASPLQFVGVMLAVAGIAYVCEQSILRKKTRLIACILALCFFAALYYILLPAVVFGDAQGNPVSFLKIHVEPVPTPR